MPPAPAGSCFNLPGPHFAVFVASGSTPEIFRPFALTVSFSFFLFVFFFFALPMQHSRSPRNKRSHRCRRRSPLGDQNREICSLKMKKEKKKRKNFG